MLEVLVLGSGQNIAQSLFVAHVGGLEVFALLMLRPLCTVLCFTTGAPELTNGHLLRFAIVLDSGEDGMGDKSPILASDEQRMAQAALSGSRDRGEADRARAVLLTLSGWTSPRIAEAFGVREYTVRLWRSDFGKGDVEALKASVAPGATAVEERRTVAHCHALA